MIRAAGLALAALLLAGCGVRPTGVVYAGEAPTATAAAAPQAQVFLLAQSMPIPVPRAVKPGDAQGVFNALLAGPTPEESKKGVSTALTGVKKITVRRIDDETLFVETDPPAVKMSPIAVEQIYCTGMALPGQHSMKIAYVNSGLPYPKIACGGTVVPPGPPVPGKGDGTG